MNGSDTPSRPGAGSRDGGAGWLPLLDGEDAERAWAAIHAVAEALRPEAERAAPPDDPGFPDGSAGFALLFAYLARATGEAVWGECAERLLDQAITGLAERPLPPPLYGGVAGIGWVLEHLSRFAESGEDEGTAEPDGETGHEDEDPIADGLIQFLSRPAARGDFDIVSGLAGFGVYALEALPQPSARRCLELVVERLEEIGEVVEGGFTWFTPLDSVPPHQRELAPRGYYNLGAAHGVPAVLSVLAGCEREGILRPEQRWMLDRAVDWLLAQKQPADDWCFPAWVGEEVDVVSTRLAWCYGDPGVAACLLTAARHAGEEAWEAEALDAARRAAIRPPESTGVRDAELCHGSAGLGHMFNRMHQASGDPRLAEAARFWYRHALDQRRPGRGVGGFQFYTPWRSEDALPHWVPDPGFLMGAAGTALGLLAAVTPIEPGWDRALAVSVPLEPPGGRSGRA